MSIIWRKVWRDLWGNKLRTLLIVLATAVGVFALGLTFGMSDVIRARFTESHRASVAPHIVFFTSQFDQDVIDATLRESGVAGAGGLADSPERCAEKIQDLSRCTNNLGAAGAAVVYYTQPDSQCVVGDAHFEQAWPNASRADEADGCWRVEELPVCSATPPHATDGGAGAGGAAGGSATPPSTDGGAGAGGTAVGSAGRAGEPIFLNAR